MECSPTATTTRRREREKGELKEETNKLKAMREGKEEKKSGAHNTSKRKGKIALLFNEFG